MTARYRPRRTAWLELATGQAVADAGPSFTVAPAAPWGGALVNTGRGCERVELHDAGDQLAALLAGLPDACERVYLTDAAPWAAWFTCAPPAPWVVPMRGHHPDDATPALRFRQPLAGREVEIRSAAEWFAGAPTPRECRDAWELLGHRIRRARHVRGAADEWAGAILMASPSTTGRQLLELIGSLPEPLDDQTTAIVRAATVGGRMHLAPAPKAKAKVPGLSYYDARVSYGALAQLELGVGPAVHDTITELPLDSAGRLTHRGFLCITATVPAGWRHVGILGVRDHRGGGMTYPAAPGEVVIGWYDTAEVALAVTHGWDVQVHERLLLRQAPALKGWAATLETLWRQLGEADDVPERVRELARGAVRAIVLKTIGALHTASYRHRNVYTDAADVPAGAPFYRTDAGAYVVEHTAPAGRASYPELTAQIWARGRVRLLDAPTGAAGVRAGALHVDPAELVAMRTDALYLTRPAPSWTDDGNWGRYRLKGQIGKPRTWPADASRLLKLREEAEQAT